MNNWQEGGAILDPPVANFVYSHRVTYSECTVGNHVYYGRYLEILEAARGEFFRDLGTTFQQYQEDGFIFPVIELRLQYRGPARYDDVLGVEVWFTMAKGVRLNFGHRITNQDGKAVLSGETWHVCTGLDEKPKRLPEALTALETKGME